MLPCVCLWVYMCMSVCLHVCMWVCVRVCVFACVHAPVCVLVCCLEVLPEKTEDFSVTLWFWSFSNSLTLESAPQIMVNLLCQSLKVPLATFCFGLSFLKLSARQSNPEINHLCQENKHQMKRCLCFLASNLTAAFFFL